MKDTHIKILKIMNEATNRMDIHVFAEAIDMTPNQAMSEVQKLADEGFLRKVGSGYGLAEKGKNALKIFTPINKDAGFHFYIAIDKPLGISAFSLVEFYRQIKQITSDALEFHLYRGDFENWFKDVVQDSELASDVGSLKTESLQGEVLRKAILKAIDAKYGVGELL